jgi:CBS domain-containing protein
VPQVIEDIMTSDVHSVGERATLRQVAKVMRDQKIGDVLVTDDAGKLCGIVTDRDIVVRVLAEGKDIDTATAGDMLSKKPVTLRPTASVDEAVQLMQDNAIRRLPVVDKDDRPIGIVSIGDLAREKDPRSALGKISAAAPNN